jgi:8-oxo-dGTP pyrophosphatase MutT (NUDIX family)
MRETLSETIRSYWKTKNEVSTLTNWHRHVGVYGFCFTKNQLLVIKKHGGPYSGRFDLPGGSIERNESITDALHREFYEETGCKIEIVKNIGVRDYVVPWTRVGHNHTHCHHIALYFEVNYVDGELENSPMIDDSLGAEWRDLGLLYEYNTSPLVMEAVDWMKTRKLGYGTKQYEQWEIIG